MAGQMSETQKVLYICTLIVMFMSGYVSKGYEEWSLLNQYEETIMRQNQEMDQLENYVTERPYE